MKLFGWGWFLFVAVMLAGKPVLGAQAIEVATWSGLYDALQAGGDYKLTANVKQGEGGGAYDSDNLVVPSGVTVTLDLNGKNVEQVKQSSVFTVRGVFVVKDLGDESSTGKITGGTSDYGAGVCITDGGRFILEGGEISGNSAINDGGGVYVANGVFSMKGGSISENYVLSGNGGGVCVGENGSFEISGSPRVLGNGNFSSEDSNVYLPGGQVIKVIGAIAGASLAVTTENDFAVITSGLRKYGGAAESFSSDKGFVVSTDGNGEALVTRDIVSIGDYDDLVSFAKRVNEGETSLCAILTNDITASGKKWTAIGYDGNHSYKGIFDGGGFTVSGLDNSELTPPEYCGLFGFVGGTVKNVCVSNLNLNVAGQRCCLGGVAGHNTGSVCDCRHTGGGNLTAEGTTDHATPYTGGVVGFNSDGSITRCSYAGSGILESRGGIAGRTGGVVGYNSAVVDQCFYDGLGATLKGSEIGCVVGNNNGSLEYSDTIGVVENCYASGSATLTGTYNSDNELGGVIGNNTNHSRVENCFASVEADISGAAGANNRIGGVVGYNGISKVVNCRYNTSVMKENAAVGATNGVISALGLTSEQFEVQTNFENWNFAEVWAMGDARPVLRWTQPPPVVSNVVARQRWPWNGLVDVDYDVSGNTAGLKAEIAFVEQGGESRTWTATKFAVGFEPSAEPGHHRATWDTKADGATNIVAKVKAMVRLVCE